MLAGVRGSAFVHHKARWRCPVFSHSNAFPGLWGPVDFRPIPKSLLVPSQPSGAGSVSGASVSERRARARALAGFPVGFGQGAGR